MTGVLIVTGGSRGIGAALAQLAATQGYRVCINYNKTADRAAALAAAIERSGGEAITVQADVSRPDEAARLFATVDERFGTVTALVNNAGVIGGLSRVDEIDGDRLLHTFATNVFSYFYCCAEAVRRMSTALGGRGGAIVNISSAAARLGGLPGEVHYAASKGAVDTLSIGLANEVAREGIRVVGLRPGVTQTEIHAAHGGQDTVDRLAATIPLGRAGTPEEIAEAALWLISDRAAYVTGTIIDVTGGR